MIIIAEMDQAALTLLIIPPILFFAVLFLYLLNKRLLTQHTDKKYEHNKKIRG